MESFSCQVYEAGDTVVVAVAGDIDLSTAGRLAGTATPQLTPGARVVLDCSGITFMDSSGLSTLLRLRLHAGDTGAALALAAVPPHMARVLDLSETMSMFEILDTPPGPTAGLAERPL